MKTESIMNKRINYGLALILSTLIGTSPILTFATGFHRSRLILSAKSDKPLFISKFSKPKRAVRAQTQAEPVGQSATLLSDGSTLLIGGEGSDGPQSTVFISDPRTNEITPLPNGLNQARAWHSATMLPDGRVLVLGGIGISSKIISAPEIYDPEAGTSEPLTSPRLTARAYHTATLLTNGQVLVVGGFLGNGRALASAEVFETNTKVAVTLPARLSNPRQKHKATLLSDGNVLFEGGSGNNSDTLTGAELYNTDARSFSSTSLSSEQADGKAPYLAASLPADGTMDVPIDSRIAVRFSKQLRVESLNSETVKLTSSEGTVSARIVSAEGGRLAFITPRESLLDGTTYTVSVVNATDGTNALTPAAISFTTVQDRKDEDKKTPNNQAATDADWIPNAENLRGDWRSKLEKSSRQDQPPLQANPGETALSGQVLTLHGEPLADVKIGIGGNSVRTDNSGRFLLRFVSAGHQVVLIDGRTASKPGRIYGLFRVGVDVTASQTNVLPYTIWMPKLDMAHAVTIPSPNKQEIVITNPLIPGLELHLPAGTVIRDLDGQAVTQISITPVPTDRPPFPLPPGLNVPVFASIQPGGARIIPPRARLIYPNYTNERPGARINFWNYDPEGKGWYVYGQGTVTANGRQITPDPGVVIYEFSGIMISGDSNPPANGPNPGGGPEGTDGDPVDLGTGLFVLRKTDVFLPDTMALVLRRTYRPGDTTSRAFGIGSTHPYEMFLWSVNNYQETDLILPDGGRVHYVRISPGTGYTDAVYEHTSTPSAFYKSQLSWNGNGWDLRLKDGTVYVFPDFAPLKSIRDRNGNQITITRAGGNTGNITQITSPNNRWIQFTYDTSNRITQAKDNIGRTVNYTYDSGGRLWKVTDPNNGMTEYTYDASHRMLTIKDARGIVYLTNEYDSAGRVTKQTQADNSTYQFVYTLDSNGKITQTDVTDPRNNPRRITFNSTGYALTETRALGKPEQQTFSYQRQSGTNLLLSVTDPLSRTTSLTYDSMGNLASFTRLAGTQEAVNVTLTHESAYNQVASITDPLSHTKTFSYDNKGNLIGIDDALNNQTTLTYNAAGQPLSITDSLQHAIQFTYDSGDLATVTDPLGRAVMRFVDAVGRPVSVTNPLGQQTRYEYDNLNQRTRKTDALQGVTTFSYNPNGGLLSVSDPRNGVTSYIFDNMDRIATRRDPLLHDQSQLYDQNGNLTQLTDRKTQVAIYNYDALNRLTQATYADASTTSYTYDGGNRLTQVVDSLSGTIVLTHDNLDQLTSVTSPQGSISYTYNAAGRRTSMTVAGQPTVNYSYDNANRLTQVTRGSSTVNISYDAAGRRTSLTLPNGFVTEYGYNVGSELISLTYKRGGNVIGDLTYEYDAAGRRKKIGGSFARTSLPQPITTSTYNAANQLTQRGANTFTYDANGSLTGDGSNAYTWNARNQLVAITGSVNAAFQYDAFGRRINRTISGTSVGYFHDGVNVVQQLSGATPFANFLMGGIDEVFTRTDADGARCVLSAHLRSVLSLTDENGAQATQYTYEPFGQTSVVGSGSSNSFQYTGRENDNTGLYFYRARYYAPLLQRFISEDPIGFRGGDTNFYAYVKNNPLNSFDPFGLQETEGQPVRPPELSPGEIAAGEITNAPAELAGSRALPIAGGLGGLAPGLYYYVEKMNERDRDINDMCCATKQCECNKPGNPNDPDPNDPNDPNNPNALGRTGSPVAGRKN